MGLETLKCVEFRFTCMENAQRRAEKGPLFSPYPPSHRLQILANESASSHFEPEDKQCRKLASSASLCLVHVNVGEQGRVTKTAKRWW